jgi:hypothetical protein
MLHIDYYGHTMHVVNALKGSRLSTGDGWKPFDKSAINGDPAEFWAVLIEHAEAKA